MKEHRRESPSRLTSLMKYPNRMAKRVKGDGSPDRADLQGVATGGGGSQSGVSGVGTVPFLTRVLVI